MQCLTSARGANPTAPNAKVVFSWKMFCNFWSVGLGRAAAGAHKTARKVCCCDDFVVVVVSASVFWSGIPAGVIGLEPCRSRAAGAGGGSTDGQASTQDRGAWNTAKKKNHFFYFLGTAGIAASRFKEECKSSPCSKSSSQGFSSLSLPVQHGGWPALQARSPFLCFRLSPCSRCITGAPHSPPLPPIPLRPA